jgi:hypothetical protein
MTDYKNYTKKIIACFYQFERSAIITGRIKHPIDSSREHIIVDELYNNQSLSIIDFYWMIEKAISKVDRISIHVNPNLESIIKIKNPGKEKKIEIYDFENDIKESKDKYQSANDYWKSLKHEGRLIEDLEIPMNLHHIKMTYLCFLQCSFESSIRDSNISWYADLY